MLWKVCHSERELTAGRREDMTAEDSTEVAAAAAARSLREGEEGRFME